MTVLGECGNVGRGFFSQEYILANSFMILDLACVTQQGEGKTIHWGSYL